MADPIYPVYYDSRKAFSDCFDAHGRQMRLEAKTPAAMKAWTKRARAKLVDILGLHRLTPAAPKPRKTESVDCGDHVRQRWLIQTQRGVILPFFVLSPKDAAGRLPAVICPHGHGGGGKAAVAGVAVHPDVAAAIEKYNYTYGVQFVRAGFRVFCPDARGFGERQEQEVRSMPLATSCHHLQTDGRAPGHPRGRPLDLRPGTPG